MGFIITLICGLIAISGNAAQYSNPNNGYYNQKNSYNGNTNQYNGVEQLGQNAQTFYNEARAGISNVAETIADATSNAFGKALNHTVNATYGIPPVQSGIYIKVQLRGYKNNGYRLSESTLCVCPDNNDQCIHNSPQKGGYACYFSFMVVIASEDTLIRYNATPFVRVDNQYGVDQNEMDEFSRIFEFISQSKPAAISVIVSHMGAVIDSTSGSVDQTNTVVPVDLFTVPINETVSYGQPVTLTVRGNTLQTELLIQYTVECRGSLIGPGCNLLCNTSKINNQIALCQEVNTGYFQICKWSSSQNVNSCNKCPWGIRDESYCADANGGILDTSKAGVVSAGYKTATIVIGIIAAILFLLLLILLIISMCIQRKNSGANSTANPPGYRHGVVNSSGHTGNSENQPLNAAHSSGISSPQNQPNLFQSKPPKSALRTPTYQYPPSAHLGGTDLLNDTLNSSIAGSQVHNPNVSRSADV